MHSIETGRESVTNGHSDEKVEVDKCEVVDQEEEDRYPYSQFVDLESLAANHSTHGMHGSNDDGSEPGDVFKHYFKTKDNKNLKHFLRTAHWHEDHPFRSIIWKQLCQYLLKAEGNIYEEFEKDLFADRGFDEVPLPSFVDFNNLPTRHLTSTGVHAVRKVMAVLQHASPDITYSPMLFPLVSVLLHYMSPSECFNCAYGLVRAKDTNYLTQTKVAIEASKFVIQDLAKKHAKSAYVHVLWNCNTVDTVFESWIWWIFRDLPFSHLVRIMDCYLFEGIKVLYRVILAILILYNKYSARRSTAHTSNISSGIQHFCEEMPYPIEKLLKVGFGIRGLTRKEIRKLQVKHEMYVNSRNLLNHDVAHPGSNSGLHLSRSFSGPIALQHLQSNTLNSESLYNLWTWLPPRYAVYQPELLFTSEEHGTSLMTLYTRIQHHEPSLIVIKTVSNEVFGAFCSSYWRDRKQSSKNLSYFGTGETFLFTLHPTKKKYEWVGLHQEHIPNTANMFLAGDNTILTIGGGNGEAIALDANLRHCRTEHCDTFDNQPLCSTQDFQCKVVEVYGFH